ncbi:MAG: hypothetical protein ACTS41_00855 [Candidatus Hodgkinia cicadicola]
MTAWQREVKREASADFGQSRGVPPIVYTFVSLRWGKVRRSWGYCCKICEMTALSRSRLLLDGFG